MDLSIQQLQKFVEYWGELLLNFIFPVKINNDGENHVWFLSDYPPSSSLPLSSQFPQFYRLTIKIDSGNPWSQH